LMPAWSMRMQESRSFSPDRIAAFMSSVMRAFRLIPGSARRAAAAVARGALEVPLDGGSLLAFPLLGRLFVEFPAAQLGEDAGLFAGALETTQGGVDDAPGTSPEGPGKGPEL
jgi:hypothetical protein